MSPLLLLVIAIAVNGKTYITNLNDQCVRCLCNVNGCDLTRGCSNGLCGPFYLPKAYWDDAGRPTQHGDRHDAEGSYENCTSEYNCSVRTMHNYWEKYGMDCNGDGVTDCFDYIMINHNGGPECTPALNQTSRGRDIIDSYNICLLS